MHYAIWLLLFPLIGLVVNGLINRNWPEKLTGWFGSLMIIGSFSVAVSLFMQLLKLDPHHRAVNVTFFNWLNIGGLHLDFAFLIDPLSVVMILVVTGISSLIHIYSIGYMHGDARFRVFFTYLNLFVFFMLILVLGNNYPIMFIGWEGVGLASYLLIGFWWEDMSKAEAGMKAFVVNRIGDFGVLIAMFLMFSHLGTLTFSEVFPAAAQHYAHDLNNAVIVGIGLMLLLGAAGKSAQFPLYVWLPDAMAGPTPVSALIHAATMVTAGVYMIARSSMFYVLAPNAAWVVALIGGFTALFAATIGLRQFDIKKVLAYSTVSQLGYMVMACGVFAFGAGVFHLMTHAFFKALLFLGSGAVIHTMHGGLHHVNDHHTDPQDIRNMGGLRKKIPVTFWTFLLATLAIAGIPGFSGFFSKDEILAYAFMFFKGEGGLTILPYVLGLVAAGLTAFYMFRLVYLTFYGKYKGPEGSEEGLHESPAVMTVPLMILAILAVIGGWVGLPPVLGENLNKMHHWLEPVFAPSFEAVHYHPEHLSMGTEWVLITIAVLTALFGIGLAWMFYIKQGREAKPDSEQTGFAKVLWKKYYLDEIYNAGVIQPLIKTCKFFWHGVDEKVVDGGMVHGSARTVRWGGSVLRTLQTGVVGNYAVLLVIGVVAILLAVYVR
ncbi:NADH-quinone oxidoreductase subunit L [bacterium]|nr:NADH-quinone oxidoreductase subunit L [bacterium]